MPKKQDLISKPKSESNKELCVCLVLDESGSMSAIRENTITGVNNYIKEIRNSAIPVLFTLLKFDSNHQTFVYENKNVNKIKLLTNKDYIPGAMTPLRDAIGKAIFFLDEQIKSNRKILLVIMTDGEENSSKEFSHSQIKTMIKEREEQDWQIIYLGANQDAWLVGQSYGLTSGNCMTYDTNNIVGTTRGLGQATLCYSARVVSAKLDEETKTSSFFKNYNYTDNIGNHDKNNSSSK